MHIDVDGDATVDEAASLVPGATEQLDVFRRLVEVTNARRPALSTVLARRPFDVIDSAVAWDRLLDVVEWLAENPNPQRYLRQIDLR